MKVLRASGGARVVEHILRLCDLCALEPIRIPWEPNAQFLCTNPQHGGELLEGTHVLGADCHLLEARQALAHEVGVDLVVVALRGAGILKPGASPRST